MDAIATPTTVLFTFFLALISPGPDFFLITGLAIRSGRAAGLRAALGISLGVGVWAGLGSHGLGLVVEENERMLIVVRYLGAGILIYLGSRYITRAVRGPEVALQGSRLVSGANAFAIGVLTNLSNFKAFAVIAGLLSLLTSRGSPVTLVYGVGVAMVVLTFCWFAVVALAAARPAFQTSLIGFRRQLDWGVGLILVGVGVALLI